MILTFIVRPKKINSIHKVMNIRGYIQQIGSGCIPGTYILYDGMFMDVCVNVNDNDYKIIKSLKGIAFLEDDLYESDSDSDDYN